MYPQPVSWSRQTFSGEMWEKPGKICSSVHKQLWPYVLPDVPIEKSSSHRPEVHFINLVKRIQRIKKKKKKLTQDWGQRADGLAGCRAVHAETAKNGDKTERKASSESGTGSQVRLEIGGPAWKQVMVYRWKLTSAQFLPRWSDLPSNLET